MSNKMLIDGKEYVSLESVKAQFVDKETVKACLRQFISDIGLDEYVKPEPAPEPLKAKGFFRK